MIDQPENPSETVIKPSNNVSNDSHSNNNINPETVTNDYNTNANEKTYNINMISKDEIDVAPTETNGTPSECNERTDHDYCSPTKNSLPTTSCNKDHGDQSNDTASNPNEEFNSQSTLSAAECQASVSSSPAHIEDKRETEDRNQQNSVTLPTDSTEQDPGNLSDDSTSSSSITSDDSTMNLIISESCDRKTGPIAPKDTPSVSKPKLGRRPVLKTSSQLDKLKAQHRQQTQQSRTKRPRQNISVTDKSQWITGDEQIDSALSETNQQAEVRDKRQRKEVHDPLYSHFTSSDYSSSDAESDQDSESEDDPNRPWCICNKPDDGNFMISCDICEYWFHSACVGVTKSLSQRWSKEGKEWFCPECDHALASGTPRNAIPSKIVKKEKKKSTKKSNKRRGRPKKQELPTREVSTRSSLRSAKKLGESTESRPRLAGKPSARSESFEKFEDSERLKELIRERKKAFFLRHRLSEQLKADKMKELGIGRKSMTASLGNSMDSLVSNTNSPNMNNLPINIKPERSKPNIVLQINNKRDATSDSGNQRIVTIVKKRKHSESYEIDTSEPAVGLSKPETDTLAFLDTTKDHKDHVFDINCKVCSKQKSETSEDEAHVKQEEKKPIPEVKIEHHDKPSEPKRLRISLDSKLDPNKILTLREPLIKPSDEPKNSAEYSPSLVSPAAEPSSNDEEVDDVYDPETSTLAPPRRALEINSSVPRDPDKPVWTGTISMAPNVNKFSATAKAVSGDSSFLQKDFSENILICGRIAPDQMFSFIGKLKSTSTRNRLILVQMHPLTESDRSSFNALFDHLYTRNRCGVIQNTASPKCRDCYILPIHEGKSIPEVLKPIQGPGLDRTYPNCLLCLLVKQR